VNVAEGQTVWWYGPGDEHRLSVDEVVQVPGCAGRLDPLNENELLTIRRIVPVNEGSWPDRPALVAADVFRRTLRRQQRDAEFLHN
jgi:hypothetical protein